MRLDFDEGVPDSRNRTETPLGVVGAAVTDAEEVGDLDRREFGDAVRLVGAQHVVEELAHLRLVSREAGRAGGFGALRPGQRREGEADVGKDVEDVAVRGVDEPTHVLNTSAS